MKYTDNDVEAEAVLLERNLCGTAAAMLRDLLYERRLFNQSLIDDAKAMQMTDELIAGGYAFMVNRPNAREEQ